MVILCTCSAALPRYERALRSWALRRCGRSLGFHLLTSFCRMLLWRSSCPISFIHWMISVFGERRQFFGRGSRSSWWCCNLGCSIHLLHLQPHSDSANVPTTSAITSSPHSILRSAFALHLAGSCDLDSHHPYQARSSAAWMDCSSSSCSICDLPSFYHL